MDKITQMLRILTVIGARPQIIKSSAISREIRKSFSGKIEEILLHTGQHYDATMSEVFFKELGIPKPKYHLHVETGDAEEQISEMESGITEVLTEEHPDCVLLYGDTNSTMAGALAASKFNIPIVHIEAGLRSFNKSMPEEINRILCDHSSTLLFCPTLKGIENLINEGFALDNHPPYSADKPAVIHCGDIMYDNSLHFAQIADLRSEILSACDIATGNYYLATIHRNNNTDDIKRLNAIFSSIYKIAESDKKQFIIPLHPRTSKILKTNLSESLYNKINKSNFIKIIEPVSFLDMIVLEKNADLIFTDSGGVQKEAYFFKKNCVVFRPETEWVELVENGNAIIADANESKIIDAYKILSSRIVNSYPQFYGNGKSAELICKKILELIK